MAMKKTHIHSYSGGVVMIELVSMIAMLAIGMMMIIGICIYVQKRIRAQNYVSSSLYGDDIQLFHDKHDLHRFGIGQFLKRHYGEVGSFSLSFNTLGVLATSLLLFAPLVKNGGLELVLILFPIIGIVFILLSALLAQLVSSQPTAGGLYHVVFRQSGSMLASVIGILKLIAQVGLIIWYGLGCTYFLAILLASHNTWLQHEVGFYSTAAMIVFLQVLANSIKSSYIRSLQIMGLLLQLLGVLALISCVVMTMFSNSYSAIYIFVSQHNASSLYLNEGSATFAQVGLLIALMSKWFVGTEEASSGAEETLEPRIRTPWSIFLSSSYTYIIGFIILLVLSNLVMNYSTDGSISNIEQWLSYLVTQSKGWGDILIVIAVLACWHNGQSSLTHTSRTILAMARDRMLPFSNKLGIVSFDRQVPHIAVAVAGLIAILSIIVLSTLNVSTILVTIAMVVVVCYGSLYVLTLYFLRDKKIDSLWQLGEWTNYVRWILIFALLVIVAAASYYVNPVVLIGIGILVVLGLIYTYINIGMVKLTMNNSQLEKGTIELEGKIPLH